MNVCGCVRLLSWNEPGITLVWRERVLPLIRIIFPCSFPRNGKIKRSLSHFAIINATVSKVST